MPNLPFAFIEETKRLLNDEWDTFEQALQSDPPVSIRFNNKTLPELPHERVPWCKSGYYLPARPLFTVDPLFHAGVYYVQEAGSMFLEQVINQHISSPVYALDLCAAPGGKSTHLSDLLPEGSFLISNETIRSRANILAENMQKWGNPNVAVTNNSAADFGRLNALFDLIVADVPCSGEGMFRKDPASIDEWSPANVQLCAARQKSIIGDVWPALKEGGILIYSTCTYNRFEDEENIEWIKNELGAETLKVKTNPDWHITENHNCYRFYPHKTQSEGFFIAVLRKTSPSHSAKKSKKNESKIRSSVLNPGSFASSLLPGNWNFSIGKNGIVAYDKNFEDLYLAINTLNLLFFGILLGEEKGRDFIPHQALALSKALNRQNCIAVDLDWQTAINFLKKEAIVLNEVPKGHILLTYKTVPLGWVKNLGTRANNLYPSEWRIRMTVNFEDKNKIPGNFNKL